MKTVYHELVDLGGQLVLSGSKPAIPPGESKDYPKGRLETAEHERGKIPLKSVWLTSFPTGDEVVRHLQAGGQRGDNCIGFVPFSLGLVVCDFDDGSKRDALRQAVVDAPLAFIPSRHSEDDPRRGHYYYKAPPDRDSIPNWKFDGGELRGSNGHVVLWSGEVAVKEILDIFNKTDKPVMEQWESRNPIRLEAIPGLKSTSLRHKSVNETPTLTAEDLPEPLDGDTLEQFFEVHHRIKTAFYHDKGEFGVKTDYTDSGWNGNLSAAAIAAGLEDEVVIALLRAHNISQGEDKEPQYYAYTVKTGHEWIVEQAELQGVKVDPALGDRAPVVHMGSESDLRPDDYAARDPDSFYPNTAVRKILHDDLESVFQDSRDVKKAFNWKPREGSKTTVLQRAAQLASALVDTEWDTDRLAAILCEFFMKQQPGVFERKIYSDRQIHGFLTKALREKPRKAPVIDESTPLEDLLSLPGLKLHLVHNPKSTSGAKVRIVGDRARPFDAGGIDTLMSQAKFRNAIALAFRVRLPTWEPAQWEALSGRLLKELDDITPGHSDFTEDLESAAMIAAWADDYLRAQRSSHGEPFDLLDDELADLITSSVAFDVDNYTGELKTLRPFRLGEQEYLHLSHFKW